MACNHAFRYIGKMPCTGVRACAFCGEIEPEAPKQKTIVNPIWLYNLFRKIWELEMGKPFYGWR